MSARHVTAPVDREMARRFVANTYRTSDVMTRPGKGTLKAGRAFVLTSPTRSSQGAPASQALDPFATLQPETTTCSVCSMKYCVACWSKELAKTPPATAVSPETANEVT